MSEPVENNAPAPIRVKPRDSGDIIWEETAAISGKIGAEVIAGFVKLLPKKPGVYRMMNSVGDVLYVGKAKNLRNRVQNYARGIGHGGNRTTRMIAETANMEFVTTHTETEALLLEANLIKRLRPRFNVLIRMTNHFLTSFCPVIMRHRACLNFAEHALAREIITDPSPMPDRSIQRSMPCSGYS